MKRPDVILLNGASSAGKTQLTFALQALLPFVRIGLDDFVWDRVPASWYPALARFLGAPRDDATAGPADEELKKLWRAYHRAVRTQVAEGLSVIVDDAIVTRWMLDDWVAALAGIDVFFVGVHCSADELAFRERARRDRIPGTAVSGMTRIHAHARYDLEIDTTVTPSSTLAAEIVTALQARVRPSAFERLRER